MRSDGIPVNFSPALGTATSSYTATSQIASSIKAGQTYEFTVCAYKY